jgi:hypothetical protein
MARVSNNLIGAASGSMGGATFSTWKGIYVLKNKPASVANPRTGKQVARRDVNSTMVNLFQYVPGVVRIGYKGLAIKKSEYNAFVGSNNLHAYDFTDPTNPILLPEEMQFAKGTITQTPILTATYAPVTHKLSVTWDGTSLQPGQSENDIAVIVAMLANGTKASGGVTIAIRTAGTANITLDQQMAFTAGIDFAYLFFYNEDTKKVSTSVSLISA